MYGFKPQHARGKPVQNFADGGIVHSIKGALGLRPRTQEELLADDAKRMAKNREAAAAVAERSKPAPSAPQAQQNAVSGYAGMSATQRREKELGLKDGGRVEPRGFKPGGLIRGPGTGTSDSIETEKEPGTFIMPADSTEAIGPDALEDMGETVPVRLSNGEFELPPEQVQALGEAVLTVMRNATHQPAGEAQKAPTSNGFVPRQSFAGGGVVEDEFSLGMERDRNARRQQGNAIASEAMAQSQAESDKLAAQSSLPKTPIGGLANNGGADASRFATVPAPIGTQPNRTPEPATPGAPLSVPQPAAQTAPTKVPLGQMHSIGARSGAQMVADGARSGAQSFFDSFQKTPEPAATPSPAGPRGMPGYQTDVQRGGGNVPAIDMAAAPAPATTSPQAPAAAPGPGDVTRVGNSYSGTNVSGNISINGQAPRNGGQVSAQNMAAADALSARSQQESMARVTAQPAVGFQPAGVTAPTVRHSGNDWQARNDLRNAQVSASSITQSDKWGKGGDRTATAQYLAMQGADTAARGQQPAMDQAAMRENAGIQREGMQQAGATTRTSMQEQGTNTRDERRTALERDEFGLKKEAAGFQTRADKRHEKLYERYDAAKTPEERAGIAQQLRELQGKNAPAEWGVQVTPSIKNADGSTTEGSVYRYNKATGQTERVDGGRETAQALPPKDQLKAGQTYSTPRGPARWDGSQFIPV